MTQELKILYREREESAKAIADFKAQRDGYRQHARELVEAVTHHWGSVGQTVEAFRAFDAAQKEK